MSSAFVVDQIRLVSDIAAFVLKRDVKLHPTNRPDPPLLVEQQFGIRAISLSP